MLGSLLFINGNTSHIATETTTDCTATWATFRAARSNEQATHNVGRLGDRIEIVIGIRPVSDINSRHTMLSLA